MPCTNFRSPHHESANDGLASSFTAFPPPPPPKLFAMKLNPPTLHSKWDKHHDGLPALNVVRVKRHPQWLSPSLVRLPRSLSVPTALLCSTVNARLPNTSPLDPQPAATNASSMDIPLSDVQLVAIPVLSVPNPTLPRTIHVRLRTAEPATPATIHRSAVSTANNHTRPPTETALPMSRSCWVYTVTTTSLPTRL
jgi:hypothetical protein